MEREEEAKLLAKDLTKEQIEEMSEEEVLVLFASHEHQAEVASKRAYMLKMLNMRNADGPRIHVDSTVVD